MSTRYDIGLRILMWIARHLLKGVAISREEQDELKAIATALNVARREARADER